MNVGLKNYGRPYSELMTALPQTVERHMRREGARMIRKHLGLLRLPVRIQSNLDRMLTGTGISLVRPAASWKPDCVVPVSMMVGTRADDDDTRGFVYALFRRRRAVDVGRVGTFH